MATAPSTPKGTRDFLPLQSLRRQFIFDTARNIFSLHGYQPIETPAMEHLGTLMGKYGEEGDRLIYKILNNGHFLEHAAAEKLEQRDSAALVNEIADRALRYDLTVPFARFVVQHQHELHFPFKRYQMQPVWRADRPQKGRYREFYQCDVDVIGTKSLLCETELLSIVKEVFEALNLPEIEIRLNHRLILSGIAEASGLGGYFGPFCVIIDKIDKIGMEGARAEMLSSGMPEAGVKKALNLVKLKGKPAETLSMLANATVGVAEAHKGIDELLQATKNLSPDVLGKVQIDLCLARGLNYYTGAIIEVVHPLFGTSISGGGRYDNLTGIFGLDGMSGVGVSFGADRIYDLLEQLDRFPPNSGTAGVLFIHFGESEAQQAWKMASTLRVAGIAAEVYPEAAKVPKQMKYADGRGFKWVAMLGSQEAAAGSLVLKNMETGAQTTLLQRDAVAYLKNNAKP